MFNDDRAGKRNGGLMDTEEQELSDIFLESAMRLGSRDFREAPDIIWHYTTATALINIITNKSIYMTETSCLNDATEISYFVELFRNTLDAKTVAVPGVDLRLFGSAIDAMHNGLKLLDFEDDEWAVTCFSAVQDDLSQWRAYGGGENGFALGFSTSQFLELPDAKLIQVNYDIDHHQETLSHLIKKCAEVFIQGVVRRTKEEKRNFCHSFYRSFGLNAFHLAPVVKDKAFSVEREFRVIRNYSTAPGRQCVFLPKTAFISRHYLMEFPVKSDIYAGLPLAKILVGPSRFQMNSMKSVERLLKQAGLTAVQVIPSCIPYRAT